MVPIRQAIYREAKNLWSDPTGNKNVIVKGNRLSGSGGVIEVKRLPYGDIALPITNRSFLLIELGGLPPEVGNVYRTFYGWMPISNIVNHTQTLIAAYTNGRLLSYHDGFMQILPNGNMLFAFDTLNNKYSITPDSEVYVRFYTVFGDVSPSATINRYATYSYRENNDNTFQALYAYYLQQVQQNVLPPKVYVNGLLYPNGMPPQSSLSLLDVVDIVVDPFLLTEDMSAIDDMVIFRSSLDSTAKIIISTNAPIEYIDVDDVEVYISGTTRTNKRVAGYYPRLRPSYLRMLTYKDWSIHTTFLLNRLRELESSSDINQELTSVKIHLYRRRTTAFKNLIPTHEYIHDLMNINRDRRDVIFSSTLSNIPLWTADTLESSKYSQWMNSYAKDISELNVDKLFNRYGCLQVYERVSYNVYEGHSRLPYIADLGGLLFSHGNVGQNVFVTTIAPGNNAKATIGNSRGYEFFYPLDPGTNLDLTVMPTPESDIVLNEITIDDIEPVVLGTVDTLIVDIDPIVVDGDVPIYLMESPITGSTDPITILVEDIVVSDIVASVYAYPETMGIVETQHNLTIDIVAAITDNDGEVTVDTANGSEIVDVGYTVNEYIDIDTGEIVTYSEENFGPLVATETLDAEVSPGVYAAIENDYGELIVLQSLATIEPYPIGTDETITDDSGVNVTVEDIGYIEEVVEYTEESINVVDDYNDIVAIDNSYYISTEDNTPITAGYAMIPSIIVSNTFGIFCYMDKGTTAGDYIVLDNDEIVYALNADGIEEELTIEDANRYFVDETVTADEEDVTVDNFGVEDLVKVEVPSGLQYALQPAVEGIDYELSDNLDGTSTILWYAEVANTAKYVRQTNKYIYVVRTVTQEEYDYGIDIYHGRAKHYDVGMHCSMIWFKERYLVEGLDYIVNGAKIWFQSSYCEFDAAAEFTFIYSGLPTEELTHVPHAKWGFIKGGQISKDSFYDLFVNRNKRFFIDGKAVPIRNILFPEGYSDTNVTTALSNYVDGTAYAVVGDIEFTSGKILTALSNSKKDEAEMDNRISSYLSNLLPQTPYIGSPPVNKYPLVSHFMHRVVYDIVNGTLIVPTMGTYTLGSLNSLLAPYWHLLPVDATMRIYDPMYAVIKPYWTMVTPLVTSSEYQLLAAINNLLLNNRIFNLPTYFTIEV